MWSFRVSRHLHLLPGGEARIGLAEQSVSSIFEPTHLIGDVDLGGGGKVPKLSNLALEFRDWPFEIQEVPHHLRRASGCAVSTSLRSRSLRTCV